MFNLRALLAFTLCSFGIVLAVVGLAATPSHSVTPTVNASSFIGLPTTTTVVSTSGTPCPSGSLTLAPGVCVEPISAGPLPKPQPSNLTGGRSATTTGATAANWTLHPRHEPIRRGGPQLAYDGAHGRVVLFGGAICQGAFCFPVNDTWTFDGTSWQQQHPATSPSARYLGNMTYDAKSGKVVLFGGLACIDAACDATVAAGDTWTWDGSNWTQQSSTLSPPPRYSSAMTYNSDTGQVLLYGGCILDSCDTVSADLWSWDGASWSLVNAVSSPGPRYAGQLAYDPVHKTTLLFSGATPQLNGFVTIADPSDTWTFDGSTWSQQSPTSSPEGRQGAGLVWDATRQRMVLFGGYADGESLYKNAVRQDTWTWDGSNWTEQTTSTEPLRSYYIGFVYDDALGKAVLVGGDSFIIPTYLENVGAGFFVYEKDTWMLDATGWNAVPPAEPDDRSQVAQMVYYPPTRTVILFGGACLDQLSGLCTDTWSWDGVRWTELHPPFSIAGSNASPGVAYDAIRQELVVPFGLATVTWDGTQWTRHENSADTSMAALRFAGVAQDATGAPILFGGVSYDSRLTPTYHNDIYRWDGSFWQKLNVTNPPAARELMQITYDPVRQQTIVYGGIGCGPATPLSSCPLDYLADTWTWDGNNWTQQHPAQTPGKRAFGLLSFNPGMQASTLFGGAQLDATGRSAPLVNDTWSWDGTNWMQLSPATSPGPLIQSMITSYPPDAAVVLFGGQQDNPGRTVGDTWTFGSIPPPLQLFSVVSRKLHGSAGTFDVDLPLTGNPGIECRSGGANGDYTMIFTFTNPLTSVGGASVSSGTGSVSSGNIDNNDAHQYIVNLTGLTSGQLITVTLANVEDSAGNNNAAASASMGVLLGDVNGNRIVSNADVASVKNQVAAPVTSSNFRNDVSANGVISNTDVSVAKTQVGTTLP
jgi:hypothetical protein